MRILITGSNRGIGLEFVRQYLGRGELVIATCRNPDAADALDALHKEHPQLLTILPLEVTEKASRLAAAEAVAAKFGALDLLINNAAISSGSGRRRTPLGILPESGMASVFEVNAIAPLLMVEDFLALLEKGKKPRVINITSLLGSIELTSSVYALTYSASKSALNMFTKQLSIQLQSRHIPVLAIHPGHVRTDMGGASAPLSAAESVSGMLRVIDQLALEGTGRFVDWTGSELPW